MHAGLQCVPHVCTGTSETLCKDWLICLDAETACKFVSGSNNGGAVGAYSAADATEQQELCKFPWERVLTSMRMGMTAL